MKINFSRGAGVKFGSKTENIQNFFEINIRLTYSGLPLHFGMYNENKNCVSCGASFENSQDI